MLWRASELRGYEAVATDGPVGRIADLLFDGARWGVRWFAIDATTRQLLLPAGALDRPNERRRCVPATLTRREVESSPTVTIDQTVSRELETDLYRHYGKRPYWEDELLPLLNYLAGGGPQVSGFLFPPRRDLNAAVAETVQRRSDEPQPHLRRVMEVIGYRIRATDGDIGHVEDFLVDDERWAIRYMVVGTRAWLPGRMVLISPQWIEEVDWTDNRIVMSLTRRQVETSPEYDPLNLALTREDEVRLHEHYGRRGYWV